MSVINLINEIKNKEENKNKVAYQVPISEFTNRFPIINEVWTHYKGMCNFGTETVTQTNALNGIINKVPYLNNMREEVMFYPDIKGRFNVSWVPPTHLQNRIIEKNGIKYPGNEHMGAFGCDSYDISGTVDNKGSKGALHGLTKFSMEDAPPSQFFLEYVSRPATAEMFFEDMLMALVFYGMPLLAENNKPRLLYYLRRRGYRGFSMNRPDKTWNKLSVAEKEVGGIPNSSEDIKQAHAAAIEMYIQEHVGVKHDGSHGNMYFNKTLNDWARFDINKRTKFDATISSGLAIMACNRHLYAPNAKVEKQKINISIAKYKNSGTTSKLIE